MCRIVQFHNMNEDCGQILQCLYWKMFQQQCIDTHLCKTILNWLKRGALKAFYTEIACIFKTFMPKCLLALKVQCSATKRTKEMCFF